MHLSIQQLEPSYNVKLFVFLLLAIMQKYKSEYKTEYFGVWKHVTKLKYSMGDIIYCNLQITKFKQLFVIFNNNQ